MAARERVILEARIARVAQRGGAPSVRERVMFKAGIPTLHPGVECSGDVTFFSCAVSSGGDLPRLSMSLVSKLKPDFGAPVHLYFHFLLCV